MEKFYAQMPVISEKRNVMERPALASSRVMAIDLDPNTNQGIGLSVPNTR